MSNHFLHNLSLVLFASRGSDFPSLQRDVRLTDPILIVFIPQLVGSISRHAEEALSFGD